MTRKEAVEHFNSNPPSRKLPITKFPNTIPQLREAFEKQDNAGDKQTTREALLAVLVAASLSQKEATDLCDGFFRVGPKSQQGTVQYV